MANGTYIALEDDQLARAARHDSAAFAELYRRHIDRVYHYLLARTQNVADAQDITAQTFITALERIHTYQTQGKFLAWLLTIAKHKAIDHFRRDKAIYSLEDAELIPHPAPSPDEALTQRLQLEHVTHALNQLIPERAEALRLRLFGELSAREIGEQMGKSEAAVKMLIHRAWQDLKTLLTPLIMQEAEE